MPQNATPCLLPAGLYDLLPPYAAHERRINSALMDAFMAFGYAQVSPPLVEFESSLLSGRGEALAAQTFRVMDPLSQEMMGFRPDITMQVARLAASRLSDQPRPLRLAYSGSTLRVKGEGTGRSRQWRQAGVELMGSDAPQADSEVIAVAVQALAAIGCDDVVVDINLPGLVQQVLKAGNVPASRHGEVFSAVESKDTGWVQSADLGKTGTLLADLIHASGPLDEALPRLQALALPKESEAQVAHMQAVVNGLQALGVKAKLTLDAVENRGFEYHSLISFSLFSRSEAEEIGRGGRYISGINDEAATGVTLYVNRLMNAVKPDEQRPRLLVASNTPLDACATWQKQGFETVWAAQAANKKEAQAQGCSHMLHNGKAVTI